MARTQRYNEYNDSNPTKRKKLWFKNRQAYKRQRLEELYIELPLAQQ